MPSKCLSAGGLLSFQCFILYCLQLFSVSCPTLLDMEALETTGLISIRANICAEQFVINMMVGIVMLSDRFD
jgi:hypothetical protein